MKCLNCKSEEFKEKKVSFTPEIRGEKVSMKCVSNVCAKCETPLMTTAQMADFQKATADAYRRAHGLLTSEEIVQCRKKLGMNQRDFAEYLGVGSASIARWETFAIQDKAQDELMRLKCDLQAAEENCSFLEARTTPVDELRGNRAFEPRKLLMLLVALTPGGKSPLYTNKAAFYADFVHFKRHGVGLTGARYVSQKLGPCPEHYDDWFRTAIREGFLANEGTYDLAVKREPDLSLFSSKERGTIEEIRKLLKSRGKSFLFKESHQEKAFKQTKALEFISYKFAEDLSL